jgi:hypothetical protein
VDDPYRAQARHGGRTQPSMEGTSGAAEPARSSRSEGVKRPLAQGGRLREQPGRPPCREGVAQAAARAVRGGMSSRFAALHVRAGRRRGRPAQAGRTGARGLRAYPRNGSHARAARAAKARAGREVRAAGSFLLEARLRPGGRRAASDLQPARRRSRDTRCPGGSGWGEAPTSRGHRGNAETTAARSAGQGPKGRCDHAAGKAGGAGRAKALRPLARVDPAGDGRKAFSAIREDRGAGRSAGATWILQPSW